MFLLKKCVWRMGTLLVIFNTVEVHINCDSNKTRETCVHIGYCIHLGVFMCLKKFVNVYLGVQRFPILGVRFPK